MKIKGAAKGLRYQKLFVPLGAAGLALIALRFYQVFFLLDPVSGFFTDKNNPTVILFYVFTIAFVLASLGLFVLAGDRGVSTLAVQKDVPHALTSLCMAVCLGLHAAGEFRTLAGATKLQLAGTVAAALSAIVFFLDFIVFLTGAAFGTKLRLLRLVPVLWAFFLTVGYFSITASYLHSTQLLLTIFGDAFLMVFLFEYARKTADVNAGENTAVFCATGFIATVLLLAGSAPTLFLQMFSDTQIAHCPFAAYHLAAAFFCVTALCLMRHLPEETPAPDGQTENGSPAGEDGAQA